MSQTPWRPTPADPWPPDGRDRSDLPREGSRTLPPDLGAGAIAVLEGLSFMYSDELGDVPAGSIGGLVHADTRLVSTWVLTINGARLLPLRSGGVDHHSAAFFLTNAAGPGLPANEFGVRRLRRVDGALRERIEVWCFAREPERLEVRLSVGADFADLFEIKDGVRDRTADISRAHSPGGLTFAYRRGDFAARTRVEVSPPASRVDGDDLVWDLHLAGNATWSVDLTIPLPGASAYAGAEQHGVVWTAGADDATARWHNELPAFTGDSALLGQILDQSARDLLALRVEASLDGRALVLPAAGLPWFLTVFGRDTLITAYQSLVFGPELARGALLELAAMQGRRCDDFKDEEPGKILHEIRHGELTRSGLMPHSPYYGTADATMLWLILLSEYWRWCGDADLVRQLEPNARAALAWIDQYGDRDGDGYVEYQTRSPRGLGNQCWRDSWDGVQFADGRLPYLPVATADLQGYVYDAKTRLVELADGPLADAALADRLRTEAAGLRERFNRDFWIAERGGFYAVGLDGDKRPIDSMTSSMGHLLWSGIVPPERAGIVAGHLMSDAMFSGWGVRTLSTDDEGFNPIGYHLGTVWPHDNSLIAMGLARYGYRPDANRIALAMIEAAAFTGYRLPEAFSGYERSVSHFPVPYPTACSPQAWSTAAPLLLLRTMLGLAPRDGELRADPDLPDQVGSVRVRRIPALGARWDVEAAGRTGMVNRST